MILKSSSSSRLGQQDMSFLRCRDRLSITGNDTTYNHRDRDTNQWGPGTITSRMKYKISTGKEATSSKTFSFMF